MRVRLSWRLQGKQVRHPPNHKKGKKGKMTNIFLTDSDDEAIVNNVKYHAELYDKTNWPFKDMARNNSHSERFARL